jgi:hypothetical protein
MQKLPYLPPAMIAVANGYFTENAQNLKKTISLIEPKVATVTAHTAIMLKAYRLPSDLLDLLDVNHRHWLLGAKDPTQCQEIPLRRV